MQFNIILKSQVSIAVEHNQIITVEVMLVLCVFDVFVKIQSISTLILASRTCRMHTIFRTATLRGQ